MAYSSYAYLLIFLGVVFIAYTAMPKKFKWTVLLAASYVFYFLNSGGLVIFLLISTAVIYLTGLFLNKIDSGFDIAKKSLSKEEKKSYKEIIRWQKRACVTVGLFVIFGLLVFLKYFNFFGLNINSLLGVFNLPSIIRPLRLLMPLGISFYTLQAASYIIDVYRGKYKASQSFGKVALFLSFFPQIVEGPIGRFDLLADPLYEGHRFDYDNFTKGIQLIIWGMVKKVIIADRVNAFVSTVFTDYNNYSGLVIAASGVLYTLQIYAEFSGCMDIVTGSAQIFGVPLSKNFERPFFSRSVNEFWRRWHITLGAWLRDYIFYSVSLSKPFMKLSKYTKHNCNAFLGSLIPAGIALFFVWFGNGVWHGSAWKYITYGMYYYLIMLLGMLFEPLFKKNKILSNKDGRVLGLFRILRTVVIVIVGMMLFRAESVTAWISMVGSVFDGFSLSVFTDGTLLGFGMDIHDFIITGIFTAVLFGVSILQEKGYSVRDCIARQNIAIRWSIYILLILSIIIFGAYGPEYQKVDFIYGQF